MSVLNVNRIVDASGGVLAPISSVMRNRIINGGMVIDQRNAGASVTANDGTFSVDRFKCAATANGKFTMQQNAGSVTPPVGFTNYLGCTSTAATSVGAGDFYQVRQVIEGYNIADLGWGTANAKTITLSFRVYSSLTGTFGGSINNSAFDRSYPFSYSVPVANTWTSISVTITGDTGGTWLKTNGTGIQLGFSLGSGSTYSATSSSWAAGTFTSATGATSVVGTSGATFYITGVQLEVGTQATGFEYRQYGQELALCQRYFQTCVNNTGIANSTTGFRVPIPMQTPMRATPTLSSAGALEISYPGVAQFTQSSVGISVDTGSANGVIAQLDNFSGLTAQRVYFFLRANANNPILLSAEL